MNASHDRTIFTAARILLSLTPENLTPENLTPENGAVFFQSPSNDMRQHERSTITPSQSFLTNKVNDKLDHKIFVSISSDEIASKKIKKQPKTKVVVESEFCIPLYENIDKKNFPYVFNVPTSIDLRDGARSLMPMFPNSANKYRIDRKRDSLGLVSCSSSSGDLSVDTHSDWSTSIDQYGRNQSVYYNGSTSLALKEDESSLSPLHCFMRRYCVEAFTATEEDVATPRYGRAHGRNIEVGQVGIQCIHCRDLPYNMRKERAVCFPSSISNIYHSIETWQRRHSLVCQHIPNWIKLTMTDLLSKSKSGAGGRRQYWEEAAKRLGMVNTENGVRFICPPGEELSVIEYESCADSVDSQGEHLPQPLVIPEDRDLVTDFLFKLLEQMEVCYFTQEDRTGGRSKVKGCPIGYPGFHCKHCSGKAGFGRYFPVSMQALTSANSDRNIFNHITKCRRCPEDIKDELEMYLKQESVEKNRRGSRKLFFQRVWERMHRVS